MRKMGDIFADREANSVIYEAIKRDVREFVERLKRKYKKKIVDIEDIKRGCTGLQVFHIKELIWRYIKEDEDLRRATQALSQQKLVTKTMVKKIFKECFNEILDSDTNIIENGQPKTKKMLLAEKIVNGVMQDTLDPVTLKGFEVIRDTIGEKPANEIISKGIQQKVIDINITKEKVDKVKNILDGLRNARIVNGFRENLTLGRGDERPGDERVIEVDVSGESEGVHNVDVLPDKQD